MALFDLSTRSLLPGLSTKTFKYTVSESFRPKSKIVITRDPKSRILKGLEQTRILFESKVMTDLVFALDRAIASSVWQTGQGIDDIVDTGALRASLDVSVSDDRIIIKYKKDYAALVHYGGYIAPYGNKNVQKIYIPPRPWVDSVLRGGGPIDRFNFEQLYKDALYSVF